MIKSKHTRFDLSREITRCKVLENFTYQISADFRKDNKTIAELANKLNHEISTLRAKYEKELKHGKRK